MRPIFLICISILFASSISAAVVEYQISVNTSSISGTAGSLDFNFDPGPLTTQAASLLTTAFTTNGSLAGSPSLTGDVRGALPAMVVFNNDMGFNDYFEGFTYGTSLLFDVTLSGPALSSPDGSSSSGSTFAFSMFLDAAGTLPALTTDQTNGFAVVVDVNLDGSTTPSTSSSETSLVQLGETPGTPEPNSLLIVAAALLCIGRCRQRSAGGTPLGKLDLPGPGMRGTSHNKTV